MKTKTLVALLLVICPISHVCGAVMEVSFTPVDNSAGGTPLADFVTTDILVSFEGAWTGAQLLLDTGVADGIYQDAFGSKVPPNAGFLGPFPALAFDTFIAQGSAVAGGTDGEPAPGGGAVDLGGDSIAVFDTQQINQAWNPSGGQVVLDKQDFLIARISLRNDVSGAAHLLASAGGVRSVLDVPVFNGVIGVSEPPLELFWNQIGPGTFGYESAANWTPSQTPTADTDVLFPLDGDVDVIPFSSSVANNVTFSDGTVRLKSLGSTAFTSHGNVTVDDPPAINLSEGAFATLDGTNGHSWTTSGDLQVGDTGFGTFIVNNGANFDAQQILIGNQAGAEGEVAITGAGSTMAATLDIDTSLYRVGSAGGTGTLNALAGGSINSRGLAGDVSLGNGTGSTGALNVDGPGSSAVMADLLVGFGGVGFANITGGGLVDQSVGTESDAIVAASDLSANIGAGTVVVSGDDSRWNFRQGEFGSAGVGDVSVAAGGRIAATADVTIGLSSTSQGSLHVTGVGTVADSLVSVGGDLIVGELGQGTLTVDLGGDVTVGNDLFVGGDSSNLNNNVVSIANAGSTVTVANNLEVGSAGTGSLSITDGATLSSFRLFAGQLPGSAGNITLNGSDSSATLTTTVIGVEGDGSLEISGGAHLDSGRFWVGQRGDSESTVDLTGEGSTLTTLGVSQLAVSLRIGGNETFDGGTGTMTVSAGGRVVSDRETRIGDNPNAVGSLTVTGSTSLADFDGDSTGDALAVGHAGEGSLSILDGGRVESEVATIGRLAGSNGTVNVGNGLAEANWDVGGSLYVGGSAAAAGGTGLLNINAQGTVTVAGELKIWDDGAVFLNNPSATLSAGTLAFAPGSQFSWITGNLVLTDSGLNINAAGPLGNSISVVPGQTLSTAGGGLVNDGDLNVVGTTVSFTGGPSTNNAGAEVNAINASLIFNGDLTNNGDVNLINTTVNGNLINGGTGTLAMIGSNSFSDDLQFGAQDNFYVDISGSDPGEFDRLTVGGEADLDGNLTVSFIGGLSPMVGDDFEIIIAGSILGTFAAENLPALPTDLRWNIDYEAMGVSMRVVLGGDYDNDGLVGQGDLDLVLLNWGNTVPPHPIPSGWVNQQPKGLIGQVELDQVLLNWGNGAAAIIAVPEPGGLVLTLLAAFLASTKVRR